MSEHEFDFDALESEFSLDPELAASFGAGRAPWLEDLREWLHEEHERGCSIEDDPEHEAAIEQMIERDLTSAERAAEVFELELHVEGEPVEFEAKLTDRDGLELPRYTLSFNELAARGLGNLLMRGREVVLREMQLSHLLAGAPDPEEQLEGEPEGVSVAESVRMVAVISDLLRGAGQGRLSLERKEG